MTAALIAAQKSGTPTDRIFVVNPENNTTQLKRLPIELQDAKYAFSAATAIKEIPKRVDRLKGAFQDIGPLTPPKCIGRPLTGTDRFAGRLMEMWKLHSLLKASRCTLVTAGHTGPDIAQVSGMGGVGKTLLAEEYALRFGAAYPGGVYWLEAHGSFNPNKPDAPLFEAACKDQFLKILYALGETPPPDTPFEYIRGAVARIIEQNKAPCLWVVDDLPFGLADHMDLVKAWFAPHPLAGTLATTRSRQYNSVGKELPLDVLDEPEALELLEKHGIDVLNQKNAAMAIIKRLGGHAMALDIAGAIISDYDGSITAFAEELDQHMRELMDVPPDLIGALPSGHERSIIATYLQSLLKLGAASRNYLRLAAHLSPAAIPNIFSRQVFQIVDRLDQTASRKLTIHAIAGCKFGYYGRACQSKEA